MTERTMTRRAFLGAGAGTAAAAACVGATGALDPALADGAEDSVVSIKRNYTLCAGCDNRCGMTAWVRDGRLWKLEGDESHPRSRGYLCGRGQGYASIAYAQGRLTEPLKKNANGLLEPVSWDDALSDIAGKITAAGPEGLAVFQGATSDDFFARRFVQALGSANYFTDDAVRDLDVKAVIDAIAGAWPVPDIEHAEYALLIDESACGGHSPAEIHAYAGLREREGRIVLADPRLTPFGRLADEWVPCRPGAELALLLGIAGELVRTNRYDEKFIAKNAHGFGKFAAEMGGHTTAWAAEKTGISADVIARIAHSLADAAPACFIDLPRIGTFGCAYKNSADTVRMIYLVNAMLGNFNQQGGWVIADIPDAAEGRLESRAIKALSSHSASPIGAEDALLAGSSCLSAIRSLKDAGVKVVLFCETNPARDYPATAEVAAALESIDCVVVCSTMMTETAEVANYVLPLASYLERGGQMSVAAGRACAAALLQPAISRIYPETKTLDEVFIELGNRCGAGEYFTFTMDDYNRTCAEAVGIDYDLLEEQGCIPLPETEVSYGARPHFTTESGKIDFSSPVCKAAGLAAIPAWTEPALQLEDGKFRLMTGEQNIQAGTFTIGADMLTEISRQYNLDALWINDAKAAELGISTGDDIVVSSPAGEARVRAKVTSAIHPEAVWMPLHYGCTADVPAAQGFGAAPGQLIALATEPATGAGMMCETGVTVRKAGA